MAKYDVDLFVIGGGSGGVRVARTAAGFGARVALAETLHLGGTCVNVGCVPKKLLVYASQYGEAIQEGAGYGWTLEGRLSWRDLIEAKNQEIARLNKVYGGILDRAGVQTIDGFARIVGPHEVEVAGERHTAEHIVIATGGRPVVPHIPGREHGFTSNEAFYLSELPRRILIVGGGYIGVEFAGIFRGCGSEVVLVHNHDHLLNHFDRHLGVHLAGEYRRKGIELVLDDLVTAIHEREDGGLVADLRTGGTLEADQVMFATGRRPNSANLGLEEVGVATHDWGGVDIDEGYQTTVPSIYALGDVKGGPALTPVALEEGTVLARRLFGGQPDLVLDYANIPTAVFSSPAVGSVGLSEEVARQQFVDIECYRSAYTPMKHSLTGTGEKTFMKLVVDVATRRVLGVHMVGADAGEIVQGFAVALKCGATKEQFDATVGIHPTAAEEFVTMRTPVGD